MRQSSWRSWCLYLFLFFSWAGCATTSPPPPSTTSPPHTVARGLPPVSSAGGMDATAMSPEQVYRMARDLVAQGRSDAALTVLAARVANPRPLRGSAAEENARLLALLGELTAAKPPVTAASLFRAEAYLAWAIAADPCMGEYWHHYMRVRLARSGYAGVMAQIQNREALRYPAAAIGFSHTAIDLPWTDSWGYLRGLLYAETDDPRRALDSLLAFKQAHNSCPVDQTLGELYQLLGRPEEAIAYLTPATESMPGRRSALRFYVLGLARKSLNDAERARQAFVDATRLDPTFDLARGELLALDGAARGGDAAFAESARRTLLAHPGDLGSWLTFWDTRYRNDVVPESEFRAFASQVGGANRGLSQPAIAEAVSLVWDGRPAEASSLLAAAAGTGCDDGDLWLASFLVAVCRLDGPGARQALANLEPRDGALHAVLLRHGAPSLLSLLDLGSSAGAQATPRVGEFLLSLGAEPEGGRLSTAVAQAWFHGVQKTPDGSQAALDAMVSVVSLLGRRVAVVERRVDFDDAEIRGLSVGAVQAIARVKGVEEGEIRQAHHLVLLDSQLNQLAAQQRNLAKQTAAAIQGAEQHLVAMIGRQDARIGTALDGLGAELKRHGDKLTAMGRAAGATQREIDAQRQALAVLETWRQQPPAKVQEGAANLSQTLFKWSSAISIGPSIGFLGFNLLGALANVADAVGL